MAEKKLLLPKFLTVEIAQTAVNYALETVYKTGISSLVTNDQMCHVVVLVPAMIGVGSEEHTWPNYPLEPHSLFERSIGRHLEWPYEFDEIARCKALQLWDGRNDGRTDILPHLLYSNDTPFWGGVKREGIVVACAGPQSHFDRMISGTVADLCIGLAYDAWMTSEDKKATDGEACFLA